MARLFVNHKSDKFCLLNAYSVLKLTYKGDEIDISKQDSRKFKQMLLQWKLKSANMIPEWMNLWWMMHKAV